MVRGWMVMAGVLICRLDLAGNVIVGIELMHDREILDFVILIKY